MSICDSAHCGIGTCKNFYIENGKRYCARRNGPANLGRQSSSFTGQSSRSRPDVQRLKQQFSRIKQAANTLALQDKLRAIECGVLRARVDQMIIDARELDKASCFDDSPRSLVKRVDNMITLANALKQEQEDSRNWFSNLSEGLGRRE